MDDFLLSHAAEVIRNSSRERPADRVLRELLKQRRDLTRAEAGMISHAVFAYYRWLGWLKDERRWEMRFVRALELAEQFRKNPRLVTGTDLRLKAVPGWLAEEMELDEGWLRSLQHEPKLWLRAKPGQGRALAGKLRWARILEPPNPPDAVLYEGDEDLFRTPEFRAGEFEIQDLSSQAAGMMCDPRPGETWWDACAGEGGKTLHLSALMENKGLIWASDRAAWRLQKLKQRAARAGVFNYRAAIWKGGPKLPTRTAFDGVLVDAPCSGVGTWHRNPHARWTLQRDDVRELAAVQKQLLAHAAPSVKPGGKLIYAVCTMTRVETHEVADAFGRAHPEFAPLPLPTFGPQNQNSRALASAAAVILWPQEFGGNGMFVAGWRRRLSNSSG